MSPNLHFVAFFKKILKKLQQKLNNISINKGEESKAHISKTCK